MVHVTGLLVMSSTDARARLGTATSALLAPFSAEDGAQASNRILSGCE